MHMLTMSQDLTLLMQVASSLTSDCLDGVCWLCACLPVLFCLQEGLRGPQAKTRDSGCQPLEINGRRTCLVQCLYFSDKELRLREGKCLVQGHTVI